MPLFHFKQKEEKKVSECACKCSRTSNEAEGAETACCPDVKEGKICCIKVLGAGCKSCHEQYENAKEAINTLGLSVEVEYITDMQKVAAYGVMRMPALVINEKVVSQGKVLKATDVEKLLHEWGV